MVDVLRTHGETWSGSTPNVRILIDELVCALVFDQDSRHLLSVQALLYRTVVRGNLLLVHCGLVAGGHLLLHKCIRRVLRCEEVRHSLMICLECLLVIY